MDEGVKLAENRQIINNYYGLLHISQNNEILGKIRETHC